MSEDSKSGKQSTSPVKIDGSTDKEADVTNGVNGNPPDGIVNRTAAGSITFEDAPALGGVKAPSDPVNGDNTIDAQSALSNGDESKHFREDPTRSDIAVTAKEDGEAGAPEASEQPE